MAKYCGVISVGAITGGGEVSAQSHNVVTGHTSSGPSIPVAVTLVSFRIGEKFFRKIRVCQQFVSQFIHPGDDACIYVFKQFGLTDTIVAVKSSQFPSYSISFQRFVGMIFAQFFIGGLVAVIPALLLLGWISGFLVFLATLAPGVLGSWSLWQAWKEIKADFP
jgi:hypothetical protein